MTPDFLVEEGKFGPRLVLTGSWRPQHAQYMRDNRIRGLVANYALGWRGRNVEFLESVPFVEEFVLLDWQIRDIDQVHSLTELLGLQISTHCKTPIDFARFPALEDC